MFNKFFSASRAYNNSKRNNIIKEYKEHKHHFQHVKNCIKRACKNGELTTVVFCPYDEKIMDWLINAGYSVIFKEDTWEYNISWKIK